MENLGKSHIGRRMDKVERAVRKLKHNQKSLRKQMKAADLVARVAKLEAAAKAK